MCNQDNFSNGLVGVALIAHVIKEVWSCQNTDKSERGNNYDHVQISRVMDNKGNKSVNSVGVNNNSKIENCEWFSIINGCA